MGRLRRSRLTTVRALRRLGFERIRLAVFTVALFAYSWPLFEWWNGPHVLNADYWKGIFAGRALFGAMPGYHGGPMHIYTAMPQLHVGPPILVLAGTLGRWQYGMQAWAVLILLCGLVSIWAAERTALALGVDRRRVRIASTIGAVIVLAGWPSLLQFMHLEDALAIALIATAAMVIAQRRPWWLLALTLGLAAGCKSWAAMVWPLLLLVDRPHLIRAAGVTVASAVVWWVPFVLADPATIHAISDVTVVMPGSGLSAFGLPVWHVAPDQIRLLQMLLGFCFAALAVVRGRWTAAPLAAFASRSLVEPSFFIYYGVGALVAALLWDLTSSRRLPVWTTAAITSQFFLQLWAPPLVGSIAHAAFAIAVVAAVAAPVQRTISMRKPLSSHSGSDGMRTTARATIRRAVQSVTAPSMR